MNHQKINDKYCSSSNFLTFEGLDIYGFTMPQFPNIDGIIAVNTTSFCLEYWTLDSSTYAVKTCYSISKFCLESVPLIYPSIPEYVSILWSIWFTFLIEISKANNRESCQKLRNYNILYSIYLLGVVRKRSVGLSDTI